MYVCGITPYDATHIGHAATYVAFDLVNRYWRAQGRSVSYVQNVTDVDDPLLERAERDGVDWRELAANQTELFRGDMTALRVLPPDHYAGAVEEMGRVAESVADLLASGAAYQLAITDENPYPDVYFDISRSGRFGYVSRDDRPTMLALMAERGGDPDRKGKRDPLDPLLWRMARPGEPSWPAAVGDGRAGWHIECTAIARAYLGEQIDLQGGGSDLIFPHHECSAAHAESLADVDRFAGHYTHAGMLAYDGEKMSKSLGNLVFVSKLTASGVDPMAIRLALLAGHYRQDRPWSDDVLRQAVQRLDRWRAAASRAAASGAAADRTPATGTRARDLVDALAADLDTPAALATVDAWAADPDPETDLPAVLDALLGVTLTSR